MAKQTEQSQKSGFTIKQHQNDAVHLKNPDVTTKMLPDEKETAQEVTLPEQGKADHISERLPQAEQALVESEQEDRRITIKLAGDEVGEQGSTLEREWEKLELIEMGRRRPPRQRVVWPQIPVQPRVISRRKLLAGGLATAATVACMGTWLWVESDHKDPHKILTQQGNGDQLATLWNSLTLQAISNEQVSMPVAARALAIVHTCMYDAWAAYDATALGTRLGQHIRRPAHEQTSSNQNQAISFAAYRALVDLFPAQKAALLKVMNGLGYNSADTSQDLSDPAGVGNVTAQAVLDFRHRDNANQLGDLHPGAYSDYTRYTAINSSQHLKDPDHWQPVALGNSQNGFSADEQQFEGAHWANVTPFALVSTTNLIPGNGPAHYPDPRFRQQAQEVLHYSATLNDEKKVITEYWLSNTSQDETLRRWFQCAQFVAYRDGYTLDQNVKLFFALSNALFDTSIACWASKRAYDSSYPVTAIHFLFKDKQVQAWAGPGKGSQWINGSDWQPYRPAGMITPAYPEYCAENSAFSAAAAEILRNFTGSDRLGMAYTRPVRSSLVEADNPIIPITLNWATFSQLANHAGLAGLYSGTHFSKSDTDGRLLGKKVAETVWPVAQNYIQGKA